MKTMLTFAAMNSCLSIFMKSRLFFFFFFAVWNKTLKACWVIRRSYYITPMAGLMDLNSYCMTLNEREPTAQSESVSFTLMELM